MHELPQSHYGDNREGKLFSWLHIYYTHVASVRSEHSVLWITHISLNLWMKKNLHTLSYTYNKEIKRSEGWWSNNLWSGSVICLTSTEASWLSVHLCGILCNIDILYIRKKWLTLQSRIFSVNHNQLSSLNFIFVHMSEKRDSSNGQQK